MARPQRRRTHPGREPYRASAACRICQPRLSATVFVGRAPFLELIVLAVLVLLAVLGMAMTVKIVKQYELGWSEGREADDRRSSRPQLRRPRTIK